MKTLIECLNHQKQVRGNHLSIRHKSLGVWQDQTWSEVVEEITHLIHGFHKIGIGRGDQVIVTGFNTPRIAHSITACHILGAIPVPIYGGLSGVVLNHIISRIDAGYAVAQDQQQVDALVDLEENTAPLKGIVYTVPRGLSAYDPKRFFDYQAVLEQGRSLPGGQGFYQQCCEVIKPEDTAFIMFSSGVETMPRVIPLSHKNISMAGITFAEQNNISAADEMLSFMPISDATGLLCGQVLSYTSGLSLSCPESSETVLDNMREVGPSILYGTPFVYKKIADLIYERISMGRGLSRFFYDKYMNSQNNGNDPLSFLGEVLVKSPIRDLYGLNRLHTAFIGGDAVSEETFNFFAGLNINLKQVYGLTECAGLIAAQVDQKAAKHVGKAVANMEIKIDDNNEILCRGAHVFSGYYKDEAMNAEAFTKDGWLRSGDFGEITPDNHIRVLDKMAAIGKMKDGTIFRPKSLENEIKTSSHIEEALVAGDGYDQLMAILCIAEHPVKAWADQNNVRFTNYESLTNLDPVLDLIGRDMEEINGSMVNDATIIKRFIVYRRHWTPQMGELTWTNKLRRSLLLVQFSDLIEAMSQAKDRQLLSYHDASTRETYHLQVRVIA